MGRLQPGSPDEPNDTKENLYKKWGFGGDIRATSGDIRATTGPSDRAIDDAAYVLWRDIQRHFSEIDHQVEEGTPEIIKGLEAMLRHLAEGKLNDHYQKGPKHKLPNRTGSW